VVNVANGADVNVRFCTSKFFLGHGLQIPIRQKKHVAPTAQTDGYIFKILERVKGIEPSS
ncbi:hypothetical protein, partial [Thalassospira alkalitolerans]|uniref:hypothetical protein n=1 Tax=Thalassospira alkalitolerans TaxID=1293890 RepID=UPI003C703479